MVNIMFSAMMEEYDVSEPNEYHCQEGDNKSKKKISLLYMASLLNQDITGTHHNTFRIVA